MRLVAEDLVGERGGEPVFSGVGTWDVCCEDVQRLQAACERIGVPAEMHYYPREIHAFHVFAWRENARLYWSQAFAFLRRTATASVALTQ